MDQQKEMRSVSRRARGLQRMASILAAAETVFAHMGYEEATTNHIAVEAGISPGSLYQFFANKEEIARALATRYCEELQKARNTFFSDEAAALPFPLWLDLYIDTLIAFHCSHPAFHILICAPISSHVTSLIQDLPLKMQENLVLGLEKRAPSLSREQCILSARMVVQIFKGTLMLIFQADEEETKRLVTEMKTVMRRYLEPILDRAVTPPQSP